MAFSFGPRRSFQKCSGKNGFKIKIILWKKIIFWALYKILNLIYNKVKGYTSEAYFNYALSSVGRTQVSKTWCRGFNSYRACFLLLKFEKLHAAAPLLRFFSPAKQGGGGGPPSLPFPSPSGMKRASVLWLASAPSPSGIRGVRSETKQPPYAFFNLFLAKKYRAAKAGVEMLLDVSQHFSYFI